MKSARRPLKDPLENKRRWREKIKKECSDRIKDARQEKINKIREDQWMRKVVLEERDRFKKENERLMREEGIDDIDSFIDESIQEEEVEWFLRQEQEALEQAMASYDALVCASCQKALLVPSQINNVQVARCPNCGFYTTEKCWKDIQKARDIHAVDCEGVISCCMEPGSNNTIMAACDVCDLLSIFYM